MKKKVIVLENTSKEESVDRLIFTEYQLNINDYKFLLIKSKNSMQTFKPITFMDDVKEIGSLSPRLDPMANISGVFVVKFKDVKNISKVKSMKVNILPETTVEFHFYENISDFGSVRDVEVLDKK